MIFSGIILLLVTMTASTSGMKPTGTQSHDFTGDGDSTGIESMTEITWNNIKSMHVKAKIPIKASTCELPISVYNEFYKYAMSMKQTMTRIASVAVLWTPTSTKFNEMASLLVIDGRFNDDSIRVGKKEMLKTGKLNTNIIGSAITAVSFDPNFQQFITGSLDFATDTLDINKIKFYISFPDMRMSNTKSTAGFMDISWKTLPDDNGVYENVKWDVFTFDRQLPPEVASMAGVSNFQKIKSYLDKKYSERKEALKQLEEFSNQLVWGSDQGLSQMKNKLSEHTSASQAMIKDSTRREEAIRLQRAQSEISEAKTTLSEAMAGDDESAIRSARIALVKVMMKHGVNTDDIELPSGEEHYAKIGPAQ